MINEFENYAAVIRQIKQRISLAQQRAIFSANEELLRMNWDIGKILQKSQFADGWGKKTLQRMSADLMVSYSKMRGFSVRNLQCMMQFYNEYNQELTRPKTSIAQSAIAQLNEHNFDLPVKHLPWTHNILLIQKVKDLRARYWYMIQCIKSHWKVEYLKEVINNNEFSKHGEIANNFSSALPAQEAKEVQMTLKDPYIFDMLTFTEEYNEKDIEMGLVKHVEQLLVEMGAGFAFMGRQYHIEVSGEDYYIDILMYNTFMHRYVVIELKNTDFKPEYIGKLNFYCSAVDDILVRQGDNRTIGLLLCKTKDKVKAEYALRDIQKPIGISGYELGQALPVDFRSGLPSIEEIEKSLSG